MYGWLNIRALRQDQLLFGKEAGILINTMNLNGNLTAAGLLGAAYVTLSAVF